MQKDGFFDARTARNIALGGAGANANVLVEINSIQGSISESVIAGDLELEVLATTPMTSYDNYNGAGTSSFFDAWNAPYQYTDAIHRKAREEMDRVIAYFSSLGYSIGRERDGVNNRFQWMIKW